MVERAYDIGEPIRWGDLCLFRDTCNQTLGRVAVVSVGSDGIISAVDLTAQELLVVQNVNRRFHVLDSWESSKLRNLTLNQLNNEIASLDAEIDAAGNLAAAKVVLKKILADDAKAWRIILWLLKREMNHLDGS